MVHIVSLINKWKSQYGISCGFIYMECYWFSLTVELFIIDFWDKKSNPSIASEMLCLEGAGASERVSL